MNSGRVNLLRLLAVALPIALLLLLVGCGTDTQQNTFDPAGDVARDQRDLFYIVLWPAVAILVIVEAALVYVVIRFRRKRDEGPPTQVHGNTRLEVAWTIAPAILLLIIAVPTIDTIFDLGRSPAADALQVRVTARQWEWEFEYLDPEFQVTQPTPGCVGQTQRGPEDGGGYSLCVVRELHIPVGREISVQLESLDVVHSFWAPKLAGKLDVIPGRTNRMWFNATEPGSYSGQCAEFCGLGHADMRMIVVAESQQDFEAWIIDQVQGSEAAPAGSAEPTAVSQGD